jgi:hypothetical protein
MGPALRPTPLSPACGSPRGHLTPGVFNTARKQRLCRPALAPAPVPSGIGRSRGPALTWRHRDRIRPPLPQAVLPYPKTGFHHRHELRKSGLVDFAPSRFQRSGIGSVRRLSVSRSSTTRHFAIASKRFQNPFSAAGLSAFASEGPIPVSISGRCVSRPIRATAGQAIYPPLPGKPVDKGG